MLNEYLIQTVFTIHFIIVSLIVYDMLINGTKTLVYSIKRWQLLLIILTFWFSLYIYQQENEDNYII